MRRSSAPEGAEHPCQVKTTLLGKSRVRAKGCAWRTNRMFRPSGAVIDRDHTQDRRKLAHCFSGRVIDGRCDSEVQCQLDAGGSKVRHRQWSITGLVFEDEPKILASDPADLFNGQRRKLQFRGRW